ncbi:MAG: DUF6356 family protein [Gammaproteobacteria bacterium]|nr:DUF6356 family protein [Gammaproteobacteria bacterium]
MSIWSQLFTEHPATVNENYFQHFVNSSRFGLRMIGGGLVCLVHALLPGLFCTRASDTIGELHDRMIVNRRELAKKSIAARQPRAA